MENNKKDQGRMPNGRNKNGKKPKSGMIMYIVYCAIILVLGGIMWMGDSSVPSREINWGKLEKILLKHDYDKIKIVNREFAEIYIKKDALQEDSAYSDLKAKNIFGKESNPQEAFYTYKFVTFEHTSSNSSKKISSPKTSKPSLVSSSSEI